MFYLLGTNSCALVNKTSTSYVHNKCSYSAKASPWLGYPSIVHPEVLYCAAHS